LSEVEFKKENMLKYLKFNVTFTGADDKTDPMELIKISIDYPFVEWGILFPSHNFSRFPSETWVKQLVALSKKHWPLINLSAHFCEPWVEDIIKDADHLWFIQDYLGKDTFDAFKRIQLNFHGMPYQLMDSNLSEKLSKFPNKQFIFQSDDLNNWISESVDAPNTSVLLDKSSGSGMFTNQWRTFTKSYGYAGGLDIDTLPLAIDVWRMHSLGMDWIDIETGVRQNGEFSTEMVTEILEYLTTEGYIYSGKRRD
tara:strand:- start:967 stop:1728 length:762 start_codon:yes stop_codon:yes gene_type:complete